MTYHEERLNYWIKRLSLKIKEDSWRIGRPLIAIMFTKEEVYELMSILLHYRELRKEQNNGNAKKINS